jgi:hypothetical protein
MGMIQRFLDVVPAKAVRLLDRADDRRDIPVAESRTQVTEPVAGVSTGVGGAALAPGSAAGGLPRRLDSEPFHRRATPHLALFSITKPNTQLEVSA